MKHVILTTIGACLLILPGCKGSLDVDPDPVKADSGTPRTCPSGKTLKCVNDIDEGQICTCEDEPFDPCVKYPEKYCAPMPVPPDGDGDWDCTWSELEYVCTKETGTVPAGGSGWTCVPAKDGQGGTCTLKTPPTPGGGGTWGCFVDNEDDVLVCEKKKPPGGLTWSCSTDKEGKEVCTTKGGLPPGGSAWTCHKKGDSWICHGETPAGSTPPGGGGWTCTKVKTELGKDLYRCEKQGDDLPPGGGSYTCVKGSEFGGTTCYGTEPAPLPKVGGKCTVGDSAWCDGHTYCGWGKVQCDPKTGTWATTTLKSKKVLNCFEDSYRPNTVCACYHTLYNPDCCERADCIIPKGKKGQICPKSPGKLCDYCNPIKPECSEAGGKCLILSSNETFCGRACSASKPCPGGFHCAQVQKGLYQQCVPDDLSCYY